MVGINDLYDISAAFKRIRADIKYDKNIIILQCILQVISIQDIYESNQIRNAIAAVPDLDKEKWYFVYHQNLYVYDAILKNSTIVKVLSVVCEKLISAIQSGKYELAFDLVDAVHCLPDIIAENHLTIPKSYWKSHIKYYRDKWNKDFLVNEQKEVK